MNSTLIYVICTLTLATGSMAGPTSRAQCVATQIDTRRFVFTVPQTITQVMADDSCLAIWSQNSTVVASDDGVVMPVISSTLDSVTTDGCPDNLAFRLSCPASNVDEDLICSCPPSATPQDKNKAHRECPYGWLGVGAVFILRLLAL